VRRNREIKNELDKLYSIKIISTEIESDNNGVKNMIDNSENMVTNITNKNDTYEKDEFQVKVLINASEITSPNIVWLESANSSETMFFPNLTSVSYPLSEVTFRVNKYEYDNCNGDYSKNCEKTYLNFDTFREKNTITSEEIIPLYQNEMIWIDFYNWFTGLFGREPIGNEGAIIGYDLVFRGNIVDLDPVISTVTITATSGNLFNDTKFEASNNIHLEINDTSERFASFDGFKISIRLLYCYFNKLCYKFHIVFTAPQGLKRRRPGV
jgi:hypothetical protein